jgi:radical SAM superfamily enzyme
VIGWIKKIVQEYKDNSEEERNLKACFKEKVVQIHEIITRPDCPDETINLIAQGLDSMSVNIKKRDTDRVKK